MTTKKTATKSSAASKAAKVLSDPKASKQQKSRAGSTLAQRGRTVKSSAKAGKVKRSTAKSAVKRVSKSKNK